MSALATDLTTLANLKGYLPNVGNMADQTLQRMLSAASTAIENYLARDIVPKTYNETLDGNNGPRMVMRHWPVNSVASVNIYGAVIPTGGQYSSTAGPISGFFNTDKTVELIGYKFTTGKSNVVINYSAGYETINEAQSVPGSGTLNVTAKQPSGNWLSDQGVSYATAGQLAPVTGTPATAGQYSVNAGVYSFSAGDASANLLFNYGYAPPDLEQACISLVQYWLADRTRPGEASRSMGGQTISFSKDIPLWLKAILDPYKRAFMA